jgi:hypothetical protein
MRLHRITGAGQLRLYRITDRLHAGRAVVVPCNEIVGVVSTWLAELGIHSELADDLARAACAGDWPAAYAIGDRLAIDVTIAA